MRNWIFIIAFLALLGSWSFSTAGDRPYAVLFYNVENLFDTLPGNNDVEFTPQGGKAWNTHKYNVKMNNLDKVFYDIAATARTFPAIIGLAEVENRSVLEDLVAMPKIARANYQIVHYDSPDPRGVDVALLYRPDQFKYEGSEPIKTLIPELPDFLTRDILAVWGRIDGERFCFFVCHLPSRLGGQAASEFKRIAAAEVIKNAADSIMKEHPDTKIVIMGDMNDDPADKSMSEALGAKRLPKQVKSQGFFNPFYQMHRDGLGTLAYQDAWNLFDNMIINENLLNGTTGELKIKKTGKYYGHIFRTGYMIQKEGQFKGYPLRTYVGDNFQSGYSDHFPVYILITK